MTDVAAAMKKLGQIRTDLHLVQTNLAGRRYSLSRVFAERFIELLNAIDKDLEKIEELLSD